MEKNDSLGSLVSGLDGNITFVPASIEEKRSPMTQWEMGKTLQEIGRYLENLPKSILTPVSQSEEDAYYTIQKVIVGVNNRLKSLAEAISVSEEEYCDALNQYYHRTENQLKDVNEKISKLPKVETIAVPYGIEKLIEVSRALADLDDATFNRMIKIMTVLARKEEENND